MAEPWEEIKNALLSAVREGTGEFLDKHADARAFVEERSKRLAELATKYASSISARERDVAAHQMKVVKQSIMNELSAIAVEASQESRNLFKGVLGSAVDMLVRSLPAIVSAVAL